MSQAHCRIARLDEVRGVLILLVMLYHLLYDPVAGGTSAVAAVRENLSGNGAYSPDRGEGSLWHTGRRGFGGSGCSAPEKPDDRSAYEGISSGISAG